MIRWCFVPMHISRTPDDDGLPHSRKVGSLRSVVQHSVQLTVGRAAFFGMFLALSFFRFDGDSTIPPTAANANR